jgi:intracellular multiplication protein IcmE
MNDFNDDFDNFDDDDNFDDFKQSSSIKDAWNENPIFKIFAVVAVLVIFITGVVILTSSEPENESRVGVGVDRREAPGQEISPNYEAALIEGDQNRAESAMRTNDSFIPTPMNLQEQELLTATDDLPPVNNFDPLANFREAVSPEEAETVVPAEPELVQPEQIFEPQNFQQPVPAPNPEAVQALAQAMSQNVSDIFGHHRATLPRIQYVTPENFLTAPLEAEGGVSVDTDGDGIPDTVFNNTDGGGVVGEGEDTIIETVLIPAGTINYGQVLIEANSDVPGPVLVQLVSGPLAGARLIGEFRVQNDQFLVMAFRSIVVDGLNQPVNAIAIDPGTTLPGVASEVDNRYFSRVLLPAAARFLEGVGAAIAEDTETTVTVSGDTVIQEQEALDFEQEIGRGAEEGFGEIADFMVDEADAIRPLVRVARGTPVGIFFTQPVLEQN